MSDEPLKLPGTLPYDPAKLSYKEWVALPEDERLLVLRELRRRNAEGPVRRNVINNNSGGIMRLLRQVNEEEKRTGVRIPGWIVLGEGKTLHRRLLYSDDDDRSSV